MPPIPVTLSRKKALEQLIEPIEIDRFGHIFVASCIQRFGPSLGRIVSRNRDNRRLSYTFVLADFSRGGQSIEFRQTQIHENQRWFLLHSQLDGLFAIAGFNNPISCHFQQPSQHETTVLKVLPVEIVPSLA